MDRDAVLYWLFKGAGFVCAGAVLYQVFCLKGF